MRPVVGNVLGHFQVSVHKNPAVSETAGPE
jgi:hypothetical protein